MTYEFPTRYKSVVGVAFCISRLPFCSCILYSLHCLSFHYLRLLITSYVSSSLPELNIILREYHFFPMNVFFCPSFPLCIICRVHYTGAFQGKFKKNLSRSFNLRFHYLEYSYQYICFMMLSIASMSLTPNIQRNVLHTLIYTLTRKNEIL